MSERPFTTKAQRALALADREAAKLDHTYIGTEHLLLGLLAEKTSIAAAMLQQAGVTPASVLAFLSRSQSPGPSQARDPDQPSNDR